MRLYLKSILLILVLVKCSYLLSQVIYDSTITSYSYSIFLENDTVWVGSKNALLKFDTLGNEIAKYKINDGISGAPIYEIAAEKNGTKWLATAKGITKLQNGKFSIFYNLNGIDIDTVTSVAVDSAGRKWFGTKGKGL
jgi:ligand-binding sensor domain-containing protein